MSESQGRRASAGGARTAGGIAFQAQVFALWASRAVAGKEPGFGLDPAARIETVGCETGFQVDDVGVILSDGGYVLIQAKGGMRQLGARSSDFRSAVDQVVAAVLGGLRGIDPRPLDSDRDRLVIATNEDSSRSFAALGDVCARLRNHPSALPILDAAANAAQQRALTTFLEVIRASWTGVTSTPPNDEDLRSLLKAVEVIRYDFAADGTDRSRAEAMLDGATAPNPFDLLVAVGIEAARTRSWRGLRPLRQAIGVPDAVLEPRTDRDRLNSLTEQTLARLGDHTAVRTPDGEIHVARRLVADLREESGGFLITGLPGAGKSGVLAELATLDDGDKVVLAVDAVPTDRALAQLRWSLGADLADVLTRWDGPAAATLYLDGLDAHRAGASWLVELVEDLRDTRWRVVASIRRFELSHSRRWQEQFPGPPIGEDGSASGSLMAVRHVVIPPFDDDELTRIATGSPKIAALLDAGDARLRDLLANPFNLSLAADLVGQVSVERLAALHTQVQLLATYWRARVKEGSGGYARDEAVRLLVERMVTARSLETGVQGLPSDAMPAVEELVSRGVLDEVVDTRLVTLTTTIRFRHHIVFDFALAAALLGSGTRGLAAVLDDDPDFVVFGRPAIDFHLADLWEADIDRGPFWRTVIELAVADHVLAVAAATATAVRQIEVAGDVAQLVSEADARPDAVAAVVTQLASALGAASSAARSNAVVSIDAFDSLVGDLGEVWLRGPDAPHAQAFVMLIWELDSLAPLPRANGAAARHAATIVRLLEIAVADPPAQDWLGERALRFIAGAVPIDSRALPVLMSCLDHRVTDAWGLLHLRPVLERLSDIASVDPVAAGRLAVAPFLFDASEDRTVSIGASQILALNESWSQAHGMLRYIVANDAWAEFASAYPVVATESLAVILSHCASDGSRRFPISWNQLHGEVSGYGRSLELSDLSHVAELVEMSVKAVVERAVAGAVDDDVIAVWVSRIAHPDAWNALLQAAAEAPTLARQLRAVLLELDGLFRSSDTRAAAIGLARVLSPVLSSEEHRRLERVALALRTAEPDPDLRRYMEQASDQLLVALDRDRVKEPAAIARLDAIAASGQPPPPAGPMRPFAMWDESDDAHWRISGIDPTTVPDVVKAAMMGAEAALVDGVNDAAKVSALFAAVDAGSDTTISDLVVGRLRYLIGRLLLQLTPSDAALPGERIGDWMARTLLALADDAPLPPRPEDQC